MKMRLALLFVLAVCVATVPPVHAGLIYDDGPINGAIDGWVINFGFALADSFTISSGTSTLNGLSFGAWLFPGDTLTSVEVTMTSQPFAGTVYFDQVINFTASGCTLNHFSIRRLHRNGKLPRPDSAQWYVLAAIGIMRSFPMEIPFIGMRTMA